MHICSLLQRAMLRRAATPLALVQQKLHPPMGPVEVRGHRLAELMTAADLPSTLPFLKHHLADCNRSLVDFEGSLQKSSAA